MRRLGALAAAAALGLSAAASAQANELIDWNGEQIWADEWTASSSLDWNAGDINTWYRVYFDGRASNYQNGTEVLPGLTSTVLYRLADVSGDGKSWTFQYVVENTSTDWDQSWVDTSRVSAVGFDSDPNPNFWNGLTILNGPYGSGSTTGTALPVLPDVCMSNSVVLGACLPGPGGPDQDDAAAYGAFRLNFGSSVSGLSFTNPYVLYSDITYTNPNTALTTFTAKYKSHKHHKHCGHDWAFPSIGVGLPVAVVPEPGTWALMILGFGALGSMLRRRRVVELKAAVVG